MSALIDIVSRYSPHFYAPIKDRFLHTGCPHYYRFAEPGETKEEYTTRLANNLNALLILKEDPDTVAAFISVLLLRFEYDRPVPSVASQKN